MKRVQVCGGVIYKLFAKATESDFLCSFERRVLVSHLIIMFFNCAWKLNSRTGQIWGIVPFSLFLFFFYFLKTFHWETFLFPLLV